MTTKVGDANKIEISLSSSSTSPKTEKCKISHIVSKNLGCTLVQGKVLLDILGLDPKTISSEFDEKSDTDLKLQNFLVKYSSKKSSFCFISLDNRLDTKRFASGMFFNKTHLCIGEGNTKQEAEENAKKIVINNIKSALTTVTED